MLYSICFSVCRFYIFIRLYNYHSGQEDIFWGNSISMGAYWNYWLLLKIVSAQKHFLLESVELSWRTWSPMKCNKIRIALKKKPWWYSANAEKMVLLKTPTKWISHIRLIWVMKLPTYFWGVQWMLYLNPRLPLLPDKTTSVLY